MGSEDRIPWRFIVVERRAGKDIFFVADDKKVVVSPWPKRVDSPFRETLKSGLIFGESDGVVFPAETGDSNSNLAR